MRSAIKRTAPTLPSRFENNLGMARIATSRELKSAPRHRWFYFPHSYSYRLVNRVLDYWDFPEKGTLADNFAGSGTTLLAARQRGLSSVGFDLSPLAVTVANTKINCYKSDELHQGMQTILNSRLADESPIPARLARAFTERELRQIFALRGQIRKLRGHLRDFFLVALLWTVRSFSRAIPDGGWLRWQDWPDRSERIPIAFEESVARMIEDIETLNWSHDIPIAQACLADARRLPLPNASVDGLVTSPPYANRHDYSRIFHIDLLLLGLEEQEVTKLRHESFRSNVEARRPNGHELCLRRYNAPESLRETMDRLPPDADPRIKPLLNGYFQDIYLSLLEVSRILRPGGRAAYVVGNVRHAGIMVPVDEITADLARQTSLEFDVAWVMRLRGNSAQQMGEYGREPARETVVHMSKGK